MDPNQISSGENGGFGIPDSYISESKEKERAPARKVPLWALLAVLVVLVGIVAYLIYSGNRLPAVEDVVPLAPSERSEKMRILDGLSSSNIPIEERVRTLDDLSASETGSSDTSRDEKFDILNSLAE